MTLSLQKYTENLDITIRVVEDPDVLTLGLRVEFNSCQRTDTKTVIALVSTAPNSGEENIVVLWLPERGRAGLSRTDGTGNDQWTDAMSIQDAICRYETGNLIP